MARRTKEEAEETRRLLLQTALAKFSESGIHKTTLAQIAAAAGVTRGAIYWHFRDKLEMLDALFDEVFQPLYHQFEKNAEKLADQPFQLLGNIAVEFINELVGNPVMQQTLSLAMQIHGNEELNQRCRKNESEDREMLAALFQTAQNLGQLKPELTVDMAVFMYCSFIEGIVYNWLGNPEEQKKMTLGASQLTAMVDIFIGSLRR